MRPHRRRTRTVQSYLPGCANVPPCNTCFLCPCPAVHNPNSISIGSAVCRAHDRDTQTDWPNDRQADRPRYFVCNNRRHLGLRSLSTQKLQNRLNLIKLTRWHPLCLLPHLTTHNPSLICEKHDKHRWEVIFSLRRHRQQSHNLL